jgi:hypothetical protein
MLANLITGDEILDKDNLDYVVIIKNSEVWGVRWNSQCQQVWWKPKEGELMVLFSFQVALERLKGKNKD